MASPTLELQGVIVAALKASAPVSAMVGGRVYDDVPRSGTTGVVTADFPFVAIGGMQELTDDVECISGSEIFVTIEAWSRSTGSPEAHRIAFAVKTALHNAELILTENALVMFDHRTSLIGRDPDGVTTKAVLTFEAFVEQP